jgi:hypothetical protein
MNDFEQNADECAYYAQFSGEDVQKDEDEHKLHFAANPEWERRREEFASRFPWNRPVEERIIYTLFGELIVDPTLPPGTLKFKNGDGEVTWINIGTDEERKGG